MDKSKRKLRGFTLLELIIVIAIIGVLAAILVPNMIGYIRTNRILEVNEQAHQIYMAAQDYLVSEQIKGTDSSKIADDATKKFCWIIVTTDGNTTTVVDSFNINSNYASATNTLLADDIESRLEKGLNGTWMVGFYPNTFTVAYACYNDFYKTNAEREAAVKLMGTNSGKTSYPECSKRTYKEVFGKSQGNRSQENDIVHPNPSEADHVYTGQYPIPGPNVG